MLLAFSAVWLLKNKSWIVPIVCCSIAFVLAIIMVLSFLYGRKNLATIEIRAEKITPNDKWIFIYIVSYMVPIVSLFINNKSVLILGITAGIVITVLFAYVIDAIPNPILLLLRYHFYKVETENGISDYVVVSRRKLRKKESLTTIKRVFEYFFIDAEV